MVKLAAPVTGVIAEVHVRPGQRVVTGDVVVVFDADMGRAELALAEARANDSSVEETARQRVDALTARLARLEKALEQNAVPRADVEAAKLDLAIARGELARVVAEREIARLEAERTRIAVGKSVVRSPVDGIVTEALIHAGEMPDMEQPIAVLTVADPLRIEAYVPAAAVSAFLGRAEHQAQIGGQLYPLVLDYVSPVADLSSNTVSIFFTLSAPELLPGLDCVMAPMPEIPDGVSGE